MSACERMHGPICRRDAIHVVQGQGVLAPGHGVKAMLADAAPVLAQYPPDVQRVASQGLPRKALT